MGAEWSQQGCLRLSKKEGLVERNDLTLGKEYAFKKEGHRLYMLDTPIELVTDDWRAIARVIIPEFTVGKGTTIGTYEVLKVYSDEEVRVVSGTLIPYKHVRTGHNI